MNSRREGRELRDEEIMDPMVATGRCGDQGLG